MTNGDVLVIGAGPSGLMAAWAAEQEGYSVALYDPEPKQPDGRSAGVFYLHHPCDIPDIPHAMIQTRGEGGTVDDYRAKVYGNSYRGPVSFPIQSRFDTVWDGMFAMNFLWTRYQSYIIPIAVQSLDYAQAEIVNYDKVICTAPLDKLSQIHPPYRELWVSTRERECWEDDGIVIYDANPSHVVYRYSCVFDRVAIEYVEGFDPLPEWKTDDVRFHRVRKVMPLGGYDQALLDNFNRKRSFLLAGRYATWNKKTLTHDVYRDVRRWLRDGPLEADANDPVRSAARDTGWVSA